MNNFRYKLAQFFQGRTGVDNLGRACVWIALILMLLTTITHSSIVYVFALIFLFYSIWRMFSKNYQKRYVENQKFLKLMAPVKGFFKSIFTKIKRGFSKAKYDYNQRKIYAIFYCPNCKQKLRAPKGRGRIQVNCNRCHYEFIKKV